MAEAAPSPSREETSNNTSSEKQKTDENLECAVCLQTCIHPAQLPCGHVFCFLCVKGIANQSKRCAMCRQEIPRDFIDQPNLLQRPSVFDAGDGFDGGYQWFYEGRNGWWQYDERTSKELEACYKSGEKTCELLIAGFLYVADLEAMLQLRRNDLSRRRRIKRDLSTVPKKGIAGLRTDDASHQVHVEGGEYLDIQQPVSERNVDNITPTTPSNTPQSPTSGRESPQQDDLQATMDRINSLHLDSDNRSTNRIRDVITENNDGEDTVTHTDGSRIGHQNRFHYRQSRNSN